MKLDLKLCSFKYERCYVHMGFDSRFENTESDFIFRWNICYWKELYFFQKCVYKIMRPFVFDNYDYTSRF